MLFPNSFDLRRFFYFLFVFTFPSKYFVPTHVRTNWHKSEKFEALNLSHPWYHFGTICAEGPVKAASNTCIHVHYASFHSLSISSIFYFILLSTLDVFCPFYLIVANQFKAFRSDGLLSNCMQMQRTWIELRLSYQYF